MKRVKKRILMFLILSLILMTVSGCGGEKVSEDNAMKIALASDAVSMDPHNQNDYVSAMPIKAMHETLIRLNPETNEFEPYLAESYQYAAGNNKAMEIKLVEGIKFHNGSTLTSEDVEFSLERQKSSGNVGHLVSVIDRVEVIDDLNLVIYLKEETSTLVPSLSHPGSSILCKEHTEKIDSEGKNYDDEPIGTGPFKFDKWIIGSEWSLVKNTDYWNEKFEAKLDKLTFVVKPEETSRTVAIETGEVDIILDVPNVDADRLEENADVDVMKEDNTLIEYLGVNASKAPFNNKLLREALAHCIDRDSIIKVELNGQATPMHGPIAPSAIGYSDNIIKREYNIEMAKAKLKEAGMEEGFSFKLTVCTDPAVRAAQVMQSSCKEAGIDLKIEQLDLAAFLDIGGRGDHDVIFSDWAANAEPDNTFRPMFSSETSGAGGFNFSLFDSDEIDQLLEEGSTAADQDTKVKKYQKIAEIITEEAAIIGISSPNLLIAKRKNVEGLIVSPVLNHEFHDLHFVD